MFEVVSAGYCYSCSHKRDMAYCYTIQPGILAVFKFDRVTEIPNKCNLILAFKKKKFGMCSRMAVQCRIEV